MTYRLSGMQVAGFRGFNGTQRLTLDGDLVVLYAPNGHGKSSLCEAIEWALSGTTSRKLRGEQSVHKREFEGSLRNCHYPKDEEAYVSLFLTDGDRTIEIRRTVADEDDSGRLFVDGQQVADLATIGSPDTLMACLILQHALRNFILTKPGERLAVVSSHLGMGAFTAFQTSLQNASKAFKAKPPDVESARKFKAEIEERCSRLEGLGLLGEALQQSINSDQLWDTALSIYSQLCSRERPDRERATFEIQQQIQLTVARAFDAAKLNIDIDVEENFTALRQVAASIAAQCAEWVHQGKAFPDSRDEQRKTTSVYLAQIGLPLIDDNVPVCPLCGQILNDAAVGEIKTRANLIISNTRESASATVGGWINQLKQLIQSSQLLLPSSLGQDDIERLTWLLSDQPNTLTSYEARAQTLSAALTVLQTTAEGATKRFSSLRDAIDSGAQCDCASESWGNLASDLAGLPNHIDDLKVAREEIVEVYRRVRDLVRDKIASSDEVTRLQTILDCLQNESQVVLACGDQTVEHEAERLVKLVQDFGQRKREEILACKGDQMAEWFRLLHPREEVKFKGFTPKAKEIRLIGEVFGEEINVSSIFSEAQLNCLGLSFYAVCTLSEDNPFDFVIIDDPVQSMDQQHVEQFLDAYVRKLLTCGKQVILLTHMQSLSNALGTLYRHIAPVMLEIESYSKDGPSIIEREEPVTRMIKDIEFYKDGNSERRRFAGSTLRRLLERLVKDFHRRKHGTLPAQYERAGWRDLKKIIPNCGLSVQDEGRLLAAYNFCVSYPHDDDTVEPPTAEEIVAKLKSLKAMRKKYLSPLDGVPTMIPVSVDGAGLQGTPVSAEPIL